MGNVERQKKKWEGWYASGFLTRLVLFRCIILQYARLRNPRSTLTCQINGSSPSDVSVSVTVGENWGLQQVYLLAEHKLKQGQGFPVYCSSDRANQRGDIAPAWYRTAHTSPRENAEDETKLVSRGRHVIDRPC